MKAEEALKKLREDTKKRNFEQSVDLIINLRGVDIKRDNVSTVIAIPHKVRDKKVCGFLTKKTDLVKTITKPEFAKYKEKKALKKLVKEFDFFIAVPTLMPSVATAFGKVLGPVGKMPSPQLGLVMQENDEEIQKALDKISKSLKIRAREASIKLNVGREKMDDKEILENVNAVYTAILNALPNNKESVKSVILKFTMSKPIRLDR